MADPTAYNMAWIDIETTGLEPREGYVLEVAIVITTPSLEILGERSWVPWFPFDLAYYGCSRAVREMHQRSGLWDYVRSLGPDLPTLNDDVAPQAIEHMRKCDALDSPMCGSTVDFDRKWLAVHARKLHDAFHYRNLDVSSFRSWLEFRGHKIPRPESRHRATDDIRASIELLSSMRGYTI